METWCYKWLPIIFGCHGRDDRSFHWRGKKFPVCARCTGELIGMLAAIPGWFAYRPDVFLCMAAMVPMIADGFVQLLTDYESTNMRRVATGILFGYSLMSLFVISSVAAYQFGYNLI